VLEQDRLNFWSNLCLYDEILEYVNSQNPKFLASLVNQLCLFIEDPANSGKFYEKPAYLLFYS